MATNTNNIQSTTPANPSTETVKTPEQTISTDTQAIEQTAPNIQAPTPGNGADTALRDYLRDGYYKGEGKGRYKNPALVDHAEIIGAELAAGGVTRAAFNRMVKTLKSAAKLPYEAQQGALKKLIPQVLKEEGKKKAPALLREIVERNMGEVKCEADFAACLDHFSDIAVFLAAAAKAS